MPKMPSTTDLSNGPDHQVHLPVPVHDALVVVIEDEPLIRVGYQMLLENCGYSVIAAGSGEEARQYLAIRSRSPDVIVSDYRLGTNQNGIAIIKSIRETHGMDIPAVLVTGDHDLSIKKDAAAFDVEVLYKPVSTSSLRSFIQNCLSER